MADENITGMKENIRDLKLRIARSQLGAALDLFIRDKDPIAVHALVCGGCELIEGLAEVSGSLTMSNHILETNPEIDRKQISLLKNQYWNGLKHFYSQDRKTIRDDVELLQNFSDVQNDTHLFVGWADYSLMVQRTPIAVQVFQVWWYATNPEKLVRAADKAAIDVIFPNILLKERKEQKRLLRRGVEKFKSDRRLLGDARTENLPLLLRNETH